MPGEKPKPIRYDTDTWLVMRSDPVIPKAVIQRLHGTTRQDHYMVILWDLDPSRRKLMRVTDSLEAANNLVLYDTPPPQGYWNGPPNGKSRDGRPKGEVPPVEKKVGTTFGVSDVSPGDTSNTAR